MPNTLYKDQKFTTEEIKKLREISNKSSNVVGWYSHPYEGNVRGPWHRWFNCTEAKEGAEKGYVASQADDIEYCAMAMNTLPFALDEIERLLLKVKETEKPVNRFANSFPEDWQLRCGGCGGKDHQLFRHEDREAIYITCNNCDSCTDLSISEPEIKFDWVDESKGKLSLF